MPESQRILCMPHCLRILCFLLLSTLVALSILLVYLSDYCDYYGSELGIILRAVGLTHTVRGLFFSVNYMPVFLYCKLDNCQVTEMFRAYV